MNAELADDQLPVVVGVGTSAASAGVADLMELAMAAACDEAGAPAIRAEIGEIAVPRGTWTLMNPAATAATRLGIDAPIVTAEVGVPQQTLISRILRRVRDGEIAAGLVVGAEARRWSAAGGFEADESTVAPAEVLSPHGVIVNAAEIAAQVWDPVQQYALIDSALAHAEGASPTEWLAEIDDLWASWNAVATSNPEAAFAAPRSALDLRSVADGNRLLAHPYRRFHSTQWNLNQSTALLICSRGAARRLNIERERWIFPHVAVESSFALALSERAEMHRWPAMQVLGEAAAAHLGHPLAEMENIELYSCFPAAVRVQQRELGLDLTGVQTISGGMPFAGGPFNHSTLWATAVMLRRLRERGERGLVTNVSGLLTKPGLAVWGSELHPQPLIADLGAAAASRTAAARTAALDYRGVATISAATVVPAGDAMELIVVAETPSGERCVARGIVSLAAEALTRDVIGETITVAGPAITG